MSAVCLKKVNASIGKFNIIDISFTVSKGEILVILGDNGAGKTKLLETIAGLLPIKSGKIEIFGKDITHLSTSKRKIGFIFQNLALFPHMSVKKNIMYGLKYSNVKDKNRLFEEIVETFGIEKFLDRFPQTLSGGEKQKVALARTLITDPQVVLLDEPTSALSIKEKERIDIEIKNALKKLEKPAIFVTHNESEAFLLGDRIAIMERGEITQIGRSEEIFYHPASENVARFLGTTNVFNGTVLRNENGSITLNVNGEKIMALGKAIKDDEVTIFIRPEDIVLMKKPCETSARNLFQGKVVNILKKGSLIEVEVDVGFEIVSFITKGSLEKFDINTGKEIYVEFKATAVHMVKNRKKKSNL